MASDDSPGDASNEIEISLDTAELELQSIEVDSEDLPLDFSIEGVIRDVDSAVLDDIKGKELKPVAVRLRLFGGDE